MYNFKSEKVANLVRIQEGMINATGLTAEELEELQEWQLSTPRRSAQIPAPTNTYMRLIEILGQPTSSRPVKGTTNRSHTWLDVTEEKIKAARTISPSLEWRHYHDGEMKKCVNYLEVIPHVSEAPDIIEALKQALGDPTEIRICPGGKWYFWSGKTGFEVTNASTYYPSLDVRQTQPLESKYNVHYMDRDDVTYRRLVALLGFPTMILTTSNRKTHTWNSVQFPMVMNARTITSDIRISEDIDNAHRQHVHYTEPA